MPLQCEYFALEGLSELLSTIDRLRHGGHRRLSLSGIVLTMYDDRTNLGRDVAQEARPALSNIKVYSTVIPRNVRLAEAPSHGMPVLQHDIKSRGAQAYLELAAEIIKRRS